MRDPDLLTLARAVLAKNPAKSWDSAWDSAGTEPKMVSQGANAVGTAKAQTNQCDNAAVPLSHALGDGTLGQRRNPGTVLGTVPGHPYSDGLSVLRSRCPDYVECDRWHQALRDADSFLPTWGRNAQAFGWSAQELFRLHPVPAQPAPSYRRLARHDQAGLIWHLRGRLVVALTETEAAIQGRTGSALIYRRHSEPVSSGRSVP
jgi:hypothetical protein